MNIVGKLSQWETGLLRSVESSVSAWARRAGAAEVVFPPLINVDDMKKLGFFDNFPHLGLCASRIREEDLADVSCRADLGGALPAAALEACTEILTPAACYNVYLDMAGTVLTGTIIRTLTCVCFRNESSYKPLERQKSFHMREAVCLASGAEVISFLEKAKAFIQDMATHFGIDGTFAPASDPFFKKEAPQAVFSRVFPTKEEFQTKSGLAIASVNKHRTFFGERCGITLGGEYAHSGCAAFGLERWVHAIYEANEGNQARIRSWAEASPAYVAKKG